MTRILSLFSSLICIYCLLIITCPYNIASISGTFPHDTSTDSLTYQFHYTTATGSDDAKIRSDHESWYNDAFESKNIYIGVTGIGSRYASENSTDSSYYPSSLSLGSSGGVSGDNADEHFGASIGSDGSITIELPGAAGISAGDTSTAANLMIQKYKEIGVVITGVCVITAIISLLFQITKLGAAGDNEYKRASALKGIIFNGAVIAIFGALTLVVGIFWNFLV